jgi:hypothetical protein
MAVVRLPAGSPPPGWAVGAPLVSITVTPEETAVVCPTSCLPDDLPGPIQAPLAAVHIDGSSDFSQVGVLVALLKPLAGGGIPVLTVSTFDTDWILLPSERVMEAESLWRGAGYEILDPVYPSLPRAVHRAAAQGVEPTVIELTQVESALNVPSRPAVPSRETRG